jgi:hypothetical protein
MVDFNQVHKYDIVPKSMYKEVSCLKSIVETTHNQCSAAKHITQKTFITKTRLIKDKDHL